MEGMTITDPTKGYGKLQKCQMDVQAQYHHEKLFDPRTKANTSRQVVPKLNLQNSGLRDAFVTVSARGCGQSPARAPNGELVSQSARPKFQLNHWTGAGDLDGWKNELQTFTDGRAVSNFPEIKERHVRIKNSELMKQEYERHKRDKWNGPPNDKDMIMVTKVGPDIKGYARFHKVELKTTKPKTSNEGATCNPLLLGQMDDPQATKILERNVALPQFSYNPISHTHGRQFQEVDPLPRCTYNPLYHKYDTVEYQCVDCPEKCPEPAKYLCPRPPETRLGPQHTKEHEERFDNYLPSGRQCSRHKRFEAVHAIPQISSLLTFGQPMIRETQMTQI